MKVRDVMSYSVKSCQPGENLASLAHLMWDGDCGAIPVVDAEIAQTLQAISRSHHEPAVSVLMDHQVALAAS